MTIFAVGEQFPVEHGELNKQVGGNILEFLDTSPYQISYCPRPTQEEIRNITIGNIEFRYYCNSERGYYILLVKTGTWINEFLFNPNLYADNRVQKYINNKGNVYQIFLVDSLNNIIAGMRMIGLTEGIRDKLYKIWSDMIDKKVDQYKYTEWTQSIYRNYTTNELWNRSLPIGRFKSN